MSLRFWLVRHGPTHAKGPVGWRDVPADLSDSVAIARLRAALPPDAPIISSDLSRAVATADILQQSGPRLAHSTALRELNFGAWDSVPYDDMPADARPLARRFWDEPGEISPPGGESWNKMSARVGREIDALAGQHNGDLVVVAHFGAILSVVQRAAKLAPLSAFAFTIAPLSLTCIDYLGPESWRIERVNQRP